MPVDFDTVADELYSLPPEEFTAVRTTREKEAKAAGDIDLAGQIRKLTRPNAVGWLVNQLVRRHPAEVQPLLELGHDLREAAARGSGDRLRELSRLQRRLISALVEEARQPARDAERTVSADTARGVAETLRAALADAAAAQQLLAGRLTGALFRSGLDSDTDLPQNEQPRNDLRDVELAEPAESADGSGAGTRRSQTPARADAVRAQQITVAAAEARQQAQAAADRAQQTLTEAAARVDQLEAELAAAQAVQADAEDELRGSKAELRTAERVEREAVRRLAAVRTS